MWFLIISSARQRQKNVRFWKRNFDIGPSFDVSFSPRIKCRVKVQACFYRATMRRSLPTWEIELQCELSKSYVVTIQINFRMVLFA